MSMWGYVYKNIIIFFTPTKDYTLDVQAKFASEWQALMISEHPHMSSQHNKDMTTGHFNIFLNILLIFKLGVYGWISMLA